MNSNRWHSESQKENTKKNGCMGHPFFFESAYHFCASAFYALFISCQFVFVAISFPMCQTFFLKKRNRYLVRFLCGHSAYITRTLRGHFPWIFPRLSFDAVHYSPNLHDFSRLPSRQIRVIVRLQYYGFPEPFRVCHFPSRHFEAFSHPLVLPILYGFLELVNPVSPFSPPCRQLVLDPNALRFDNIDKCGQKHRNNVHYVVYYGEHYPLGCLCYALHGAIF